MAAKLTHVVVPVFAGQVIAAVAVVAAAEERLVDPVRRLRIARAQTLPLPTDDALEAGVVSETVGGVDCHAKIEAHP
jgi:hypothetical protein